MQIRFHIDPTTGLPHIYEHDVSEHEVEDILGRPLQDMRGRENSRIAIGQTGEGRYLKVIYVPDPIHGLRFRYHSLRVGSQGETGSPRQEKEKAMTANKYPPGWNETRVRRVLEYYESQSDEEAAAEIESASERTTMEVPVALVPAVRKLIAKRRLSRARPTKTQNKTLQPASRARRKSKPQRNSRAARG